MSFTSAIGVGTASDDERVLLELTESQPAAEILDRMNNSLPPGMRVLSVDVVPENTKSPLSELNASEYMITLRCLDGCTPDAIEQSIRDLLDAGEIRITRERDGRTKEIDLRQYLVDAGITGYHGSTIDLGVTLKSTNSGGARPLDVIQALRRSSPNLATAGIRRLRQFKCSCD
jgi:radical SAM-linked protein